MNYYAWRLWKLLTQLQGIDEEMGVAAAQTLQNATDGQALAVWNAVGKYEKSHPLPTNWRVADSAMMRVVNDLYKATQTLVDDAQRLEDNTSGGVTSVTVLNLGHVVYAGLGDLTTLNGAIGQLGACASKPAAKPTAKPTPRPTPRSAVQTGNGSGPGFHGSCYAFRAQLWKLNTQTAKAYGTYDSTLAAYTNGSLSEADTLSLLAQLRHALDGGNVGNPKLPGLVQAITTTNVRYGLAGWGNLKGPYAWAAFKTFLAADDLSSTVDPIVTGNDLAAAQIYGSIYSEGKRNVNYAWDALKQLRCKS